MSDAVLESLAKDIFPPIMPEIQGKHRLGYFPCYADASTQGYLDEDKKIEEDADIRKLLLEALLQLCSTKKAREIIRDQNAYLILRELHKIESDETVKLACENVIDILIKKEDEIKFDNYKTVEVPEDLHEKFDKELELEKSEREKEMEKSEN